jgi:hypothetical protein
MASPVLSLLRPVYLCQGKALFALGSVPTRFASNDNLKNLEIKDDTKRLFRDFKYSLVRHTATAAKQDKRLASMIKREEDRPLVFVFGWAGASDKNLDKYAEIYRKAGCDTMAYFLPTRFIFSATASVPLIAKRLMSIADKEGLLGKPIFFHDLSDTGTSCAFGPDQAFQFINEPRFVSGLMVYQGVNKVMKDEGVKLDICGHVLDSCPGPRPKATLPRTIVLGFVNYGCAIRDGMGPIEALKNTYRCGTRRLRRI